MQPGHGRGVVAAFERRLQQELRLGGGAEGAGPGCRALQVIAGPVGHRRYVVGVRRCVDGVQQVLGHDLRQVAGRVVQRSQVRRGGDVPGLAVAPRLGGVGDLAHHRLDEPVLATLGAEPVGLDGEDLLAAQATSSSPVEVVRVGAERDAAPRG